MTRVLRLGHRPERDKRVTTHVCLVARAFGAAGIVLSNDDATLVKGVSSVAERFGGGFTIEVKKDWRKLVRNHDGPVVHLTMYGEPLARALPKIRAMEGEPLIVVGAEKVPRDLYDLADFNVSVTNQPHSEVAALAIVLDRLHGGDWETLSHRGGAEILPMERGKRYTSAVEDGKWPSREECLTLLKEEGCDEKVVAHCEAVEARALRWASLANADLGLVRAGSLLHDVGRSKGHGVRHGLDGYEILKRRKLPEALCRFALVHVGAGIDREEAVKLGLPAIDMLPETLEEKLVCHADTLTDGSQRGTLWAALKSMLDNGAVVGAKRMVELHGDMERVLGAPPESI